MKKEITEYLRGVITFLAMTAIIWVPVLLLILTISLVGWFFMFGASVFVKIAIIFIFVAFLLLYLFI